MNTRINPLFYTKYLLHTQTNFIDYFFPLVAEDADDTRDSGFFDACGEGASVCGVTGLLACPGTGLMEISVDWALDGREAARSARSRERIFSNAILSSFSASNARCSARSARFSASLLRKKKM